MKGFKTLTSHQRDILCISVSDKIGALTEKLKDSINAYFFDDAESIMTEISEHIQLIKDLSSEEDNETTK